MTESRFFPTLYKRCLKKGLLEKGAAAIQTEIDKMGISAVVEKKGNLSSFDIDGYLIRHENSTAFFPLRQKANRTNYGVKYHRTIFLDVDVVVPPYVAMGYLSNFAARIKDAATPQEKDKIAEEMLRQAYNDPTALAEMCVGIYKKDPCIAPFYGNIIQAIEAHYFGLCSASILTLIPCIEGIIRNLAAMVDLNISDRIDARNFLHALTKIQKNYINNVELNGIVWTPNELRTVEYFDEFHELIQMIESIRFFIKYALYRHTSDYERTSQLNRHGIVHGLLSDFNSTTNFYRLIVLINSLSVASIVAGRAASLFHPAPTEESRLLAMHFCACQAIQFQSAYSKN